jgi:hypothetical protein
VCRGLARIDTTQMQRLVRQIQTEQTRFCSIWIWRPTRAVDREQSQFQRAASCWSGARNARSGAAGYQNLGQKASHGTRVWKKSDSVLSGKNGYTPLDVRAALGSRF